MIPTLEEPLSPTIQQPSLTDMELDVASAAGSRVVVLIVGRAGSGKEGVARLIHDRSSRAAASFVAVDCAGVGDDYLEEVLFRPMEAARGGPDEATGGLFDGAPSGTVLLTGVAELSPRGQTLLLDLLASRAAASSTGTPAPPRLIVSTARDLHADVVAGRFREDLYYRLNVICVTVPPEGTMPAGTMDRERVIGRRAARVFA